MQRTAELKSLAKLHAEILAAIQARDPELARRKMELHLRRAERAHHKEEPSRRRVAVKVLEPVS